MSVKDVFSARLLVENAFPNPIYEDITSGILNVDIVQGTDVYEGPYQQIDTGQFTIVSRNPNLDPKVNPNIKFNSVIDFLDSRKDGVVFFRGYVTDIDVQYQRDDNPIITISGTDVFGLLQRRVFSEEDVEQIVNDLGDFEVYPEDANGSSLFMLLNYLYLTDLTNKVDYNYITSLNPGQSSATPSEDLAAYAPSRIIPQVGETHLDVINRHAQTNLNYFSIKYDEGPETTTIEIYPFAKYNSFYWAPQQDPALKYPIVNFSSDPADNKPYESILINNNYTRLTNSIAISNEYRFVEDLEVSPYQVRSVFENFGNYVSSESESQYGVTRVNLNTTMPQVKANNDEFARYAKDIFQVVAFPSDEIQQIVFDNARYQDIQDDKSYSDAKLNQFIRIKHQVNDTETINRFYDIAGIRHNITSDKWQMSFTFKPSQEEIAYIYQGQSPTIEMNSLTGDSNFNFTATLSNYDAEEIEEVYWCLNGTNNDLGEQWFFTADGFRYKDEEVRTGLTQTWNFDDDGILADVETGGYGTGEWYVIPYVFFKNGWIVAPNVKLTVGTPEVDAEFNWTQNLTNNFGQVQFIDDSRNNEIGEPDSYFWEFGDGTTSTLKNPVHIYDPDPDETEYEVSLTVFAYGEDQEKVYDTRTQTITLVQPTMVPNFTFTVSQNTVRFTNTSTNVGFEEPDAYFWEFGDGEVSTAKNPIKVLPALQDVNTTYSVKLTIKNIWEQTANISKNVTLNPRNSSGNYPVRYIKFRIDSYTAPPPNVTNYFRVINPILFDLKGLTSGTNLNLFFEKKTRNVTDEYFPFSWFATDGDGESNPFNNPLFVEEDYRQGNLTRDSQNLTPIGSQPGRYGIQPVAREGDIQYRWEIVLDLGSRVYLINDIILSFRDYFSSLTGFREGLRTADFYPKINVDFATTIGNYVINSGNLGPPILTGDWVNVGYFKVDGGRMDPTQPSGVPTQVTKTITKIRPLPLNIPYFYYTFSNRTVSFESVETADSYAWTFGDGTTSTLKNPVKTYSSYGTYNVTLAVTNGGVVTRTTTEPVIVRVPVT
jgi:PKD repeat protein